MKKKMNKAIAGITAAAMFFSGAMFSPGVMTLVYADEMAEVPEVVQNNEKTEAQAPAQNETNNKQAEQNAPTETTNSEDSKEAPETKNETTEEIDPTKEMKKETP